MRLLSLLADKMIKYEKQKRSKRDSNNDEKN